jgi:hypothetical protein
MKQITTPKEKLIAAENNAWRAYHNARHTRMMADLQAAAGRITAAADTAVGIVYRMAKDYQSPISYYATTTSRGTKSPYRWCLTMSGNGAIKAELLPVKKAYAFFKKKCAATDKHRARMRKAARKKGLMLL